MKALSTLKSAINQSSSLGVIALVMLVPVIYPHLAFAADQTSGQTKAQVFDINVSDPSLIDSAPKQNTDNSQNSISYDQIMQSDPLAADLHSYLENHNSPLADYTTQLLAHDNWKTVIAISFVESNMCVHNLRYNCSGIGGPGHFYAFKDFGGWIDCMSDLLTTRYDGWSLDKMNGVYVQPKSANWSYGSKKVFAELNALEQQAEGQRRDLAQSQTVEISSITTFSEVAFK